MRIEIYNESYKEKWDDFVLKSKNGTFLFFRDFIEYHGSRFNDHSLLFYDNEFLVALMPGHIEDQVFYTHKGLTYGGLIMGTSTTAQMVLTIFEHLIFTFKQQGIEKIVYKAVPHIYHMYPAEEDLYALFRHGATILERNISSTIRLSERLEYSKSRKNGIKKSQSHNLRVEYSVDLAPFWEILTHNLQIKYNKQPVHTLHEINFLKKRFSEDIHLYVVKDEGDVILGGCLLFETQRLVHIQYTAATEKGKSLGAVDLLIDHIINIYSSRGKEFLDYGISNENGGLLLNENLIYQKEGFGGRGIIYDIYIVKI